MQIVLKRMLSGCLAIGVVLLWVGALSLRPTRAAPPLQSMTLRDAVNEVLRARPLKAEWVWEIVSLQEVGDVGMAFVVVRVRATQTLVSYQAELIVAQRLQGAWQASDKTDAAHYNARLRALPDTLLAPHMKSFLARREPLAPQTVANVSGYKLPWSAEGQACVVQTDNTGGNCGDPSTGHGYAGVDFHIEDGQTSGEVLAAKDGTVVFRKDTSNDGCPTCDWTLGNLVVLQHGANEYSWYLHLAQYSIPSAIQVGVFAPRGTLLGMQGSTGYSTGNHLHFHVAPSYTCCLNESDPIRIMPFWPGDAAMIPVDFDEISWSALRTATFVTSQNTRADCNSVQPGNFQVTIYTFKDFCGSARILAQGDYPNDISLSFRDNSVSSLKVGAAMKAVLCRDENFGGMCEEFSANASNLANNLIGDNQTSSVRVQLRVSAPPTPTLLGPANQVIFREGQPISLTWTTTGVESFGEFVGGPFGTTYFGWQTTTNQPLGALPVGYTYSWRIRARNIAGESPWSASRTFSVKPSAPSGVTATMVTCNSLNLSWVNNSAASVSYNVYRNGALVASTAVTNDIQTGLIARATYVYTVTALRNNLESDASAALTVVTPACPVPIAYIYDNDVALRDSFNSLLIARNFSVTLVPQSSAPTYDYSGQRALIIGADTSWAGGVNLGTLTNGAPLIVGMGQGGANFLGAAGLQIDASRALTASGQTVLALNPTLSFWSGVSSLNLPPDQLVALYSTPTSLLAISHTQPISDVIPLGQQPNEANRYPLIAQLAQSRCYLLWGFQGSATALTAVGQDVFTQALQTWPCAQYRSLLPLIVR